jgi:large subunit ribosomal protein L10
MAKTRQQKEETLVDLTAAFMSSKSAVLVNYQGLKVKEAEELRRKAEKEGVNYIVAKKTLLTKALKAAGTEYDVNALNGMIGVATAADEVAAARLLSEFGKAHESMKILSAVVDGKIVNAAAVAALASLPSRQVLLAQVVGTINAPVSGFVNVLVGNLRGLVNVLNAVRDAKSTA